MGESVFGSGKKIRNGLKLWIDMGMTFLPIGLDIIRKAAG